MLNRRHFLQSIIAAAASPAVLQGCVDLSGRSRRSEGLQLDPGRLIDLVDGLDYTTISRIGKRMSDGLRTPGAHDGMGTFAGQDGRVILVRNHELNHGYKEDSAMAEQYPTVPKRLRGKFYDLGRNTSPGIGGTTTSIYNPATRRVEREFLSLAGTETNCAGGTTPWGSWLSCEECFEDPGQTHVNNELIVRERRHGYVFEVPSSARTLVNPVPLKEMGRFEHEACAVHPQTGIVYMTEDRHHSLFYRFIPNVPGELVKGGKLQALAVAGARSMATHNWDGKNDMPLREPVKTRWLDLDNADSDDNDLRLRGAEQGAAMFARGEGLCPADDRFAFTCTIGGPRQLGQVFTYAPSPYEGTPEEINAPGSLELIAEAGADSLLRNCDNLTQAPWGDLVVCEDTSGYCGIIGVRPDGTQYQIAHNPYSKSEFAGVCFSPDGQTMFVNIQYPGMTVAVTGNWQQFAAAPQTNP